MMINKMKAGKENEEVAEGESSNIQNGNRNNLKKINGDGLGANLPLDQLGFFHLIRVR